jgi:uncharacterized protein YndB with AHSA1/START domain
MAAAITKPSLTIKRRFKAPPAKVYGAWTDPEKMSQWMGPAAVQTVHAECDARVGGRYAIRMIMSGGKEHDVSGVYREIIPNEKLCFTWAWKDTPERESLVTVTFRDDGGGTLMTLHHERFFDEDARDRHDAGWTGTMERLEKFLA